MLNESQMICINSHSIMVVLIASCQNKLVWIMIYRVYSMIYQTFDSEQLYRYQSAPIYGLPTGGDSLV
jgi:hypothetical protein